MKHFVVFSLLAVALSATAAPLQTVQAHVPPAVKALTPAGRLPATNVLNLAIALPLRNEPALSNLLPQIYDPANPNYHHYLTPAQFTEKFGPTAKDYQTLIAFAKANDLQVTATHSNRMILDVSGTVPEVEKALHTTFHIYQHPSEKRLFFAPDIEPSLNLSVPVLHISGLDNYALPRPHFHARLVGHDVRSASPNVGSGPSGTFMGKDFRAAYVPDTALDGSGQAVGLLQFDGYSATDIAYYESVAGLQSIPLQNVLLDGFSGFPTGTGGEVEVSLDIEMVISMATNISKIIVYEAGPAGDWHDILNRMADDNLAKQLSCSWYIPGGRADSVADLIFQQMALQGQSFFNASGDSDAYTGLIDFPGDTPYITQVGGTTLTTTGPGGSRVSETVWNWGTEYGRNGIGSSGGISTQYPIPSWQTNISMTANQGSTTKRNTPDVAMTADNVYVRADGADYNVGGTSCAAPLWAGFAALVNQQAAGSGQSVIGFINPAADAIGSGAIYTTAFHDITTGNNTWSGSPTKFYAIAGYDLCAGWGTPSGQNLINALANPEPLLVTPLTGFAAIGGMGGPFFPVASTNYSLTNIGTNTLTWTLSNTSAWLNVSSTSGTLSPGGPAAAVTVSLNNVASNLMVGTYGTTLWFTNQNDNLGQGRQFTLSVIAPPSITQQPTNQTVLEGATAAFAAQANGGLPLVYHWQLNGTNLTDDGNVHGSTTTNLIISDVSAADVGTYSVLVTNFAGAATSSNATLVITPSAPVIILQPTNQTVGEGTIARFSVGVIGTTPFAFQWTFNGTNLPNGTNAVLTLTDVQFTNDGNYAVFITNVLGSIQSSNATLTVTPCDPLPSGIVAWWQAEDNALDAIGANNGTLMNGTGFTNGEVGMAFNLNGVNNYVLANPASSNFDVGQGSGVTFEEWIKPTTVNAEELLFEYERALGTGSGSDVGIGFAIHANSGGILYANLTDTTGEAHEFISPAGLLSAGVWQHVVMTYDKASGIGAFYLNGLAITVTNLGTFTPQTSFTNLLLGARTTFNSVYSPGAVYSGALDEISLYDRALSSNEIAAIYLAGSGGKCFEPTPPVITVQPTNQTDPVGGTAIFAVTAAGTPPLYYQWSFDGTNISGATKAGLILSNLQINQSGSYSLAVSNLYGFTNSTDAALTVFGIAPFVTGQPTNQTVIVGSTVTFNVSAGGTAPLEYQWNISGTNINGATNATLVLTNVQFGQSGNYSVSITNSFGLTNSAVAVLVVNPLPPCDPVPSGIVAWWQAESNSLDFVAGNNGTLVNGTGFGPGEIETAFSLNGINNYVLANPSAPANLDVGQGEGLTFEEWINPNTVSAEEILLEYERALGTGNGSDVGIGMAIHADSGGILYANLTDTGGGAHEFTSPPNLLVPGVWQHVAMTYDKASGLAVFYINGSLVTVANLGNFTPQTGFTNVLLGARTTFHSVSSPSSAYSGKLDEISLYDRALSSNEIAAIYLAGSAGKCFTPTPPEITVQPTDQTAPIGGVATFAVTAAGTPPLTYQWNFNGTNIASATNATLTLTNLQLASSGNYSVLVTNLYGSTNSIAAVLTVYGIPPTISVQPTNQIVAVGGIAAFGVVAGGTLPLAYQWAFNGTNIANATNSTLTLTNLQLVNNGGYSVLITNLFGFTNSVNAVLTVYGVPPFITTQPTNQTVIIGGAAIFRANASGTSPLAYQWNFNGTNLINATNSSLTLTNLQLDQSGNYSVLITNLFGSTNSATAILTVNPPPSCDPAPSGIVGWWAGESNALDSVANNNGILMNGTSYTNGEVGAAFNLNGVNNYVLASPASSSNLDIGQGSGVTFEEWIKPTTVTAEEVLLEYERALGTFSGSDVGIGMAIHSAYPSGFLYANLTDTSGGVHEFTSPPNLLTAGVWQHIAMTYDKASGLAAFYINNLVVTQVNIGTFTPQTSFTNVLFGARTTFNSISGPGAVYSGKLDEMSLYNRALSSNEIAAIYQAGSIGKCPLPPNILGQPASQAVNVNGTATFKVIAGGTPALAYQWSFNGTNLANATNAALTLASVQPVNAGVYSVLVSNTAGLTNSANAILTVLTPPMITAQPTNVTVAAGSSASFSVTASGSSPLSYQWSLNGIHIVGATNVMLSLTNVQLADEGNYSVAITNLFGSATSSNALLTVQAPPAIIANPTNLVVKVGDTAIFTAAATGSPALGYQWTFNLTNNLALATNAVLAITNVQLFNAGIYALTVTNPFGTTFSSNATLTVIDTLDHFTWSPIPSPRFVNAPFGVTIQAMDSINQVFSNFTGSVLLATTDGVPVNPPGSGGFVQGVWAGSITIPQSISNLVLKAYDGASGRVGLANPINVLSTPSLAVAQSGSSLLLFWPMDPAGFSLEYSTNFVPSQWAPVTAPPLQIGNQWLESIQIGYTNELYLYRLHYTLPY